MLPFETATCSKLAEKHPDMSRDLFSPTEPNSHDKSIFLNVTSVELRRCISRFNPGSGSGHDCLLPKLSKDLTAESMGALGNDLLDALGRFSMRFSYRETCQSQSVQFLWCQDLCSTEKGWLLETNCGCLLPRKTGGQTCHG